MKNRIASVSVLLIFFTAFSAQANNWINVNTQDKHDQMLIKLMRKTHPNFARNSDKGKSTTAAMRASGGPVGANTMFAPASAKAAVSNVRYTVADLGTLGGTGSFATNINNSGTILGVSKVNPDNQDQFPFVFSRGKRIQIGDELFDTGPVAINRAGWAIIEYPHRVFYYDTKANRSSNYDPNSDPTINHAKETIFLVPKGMNDDNQIVGNGTSIDNNTGERVKDAFILQAGSLHRLSVFGQEASDRSASTSAINNKGAFVGSKPFTANSPSHAFLVENGVVKDIHPADEPQNSTISSTFDINNRGQVLGNVSAVNDQTGEVTNKYSFIYDHGKYIKFGSTADNIAADPLKLNDRAEVIGTLSVPVTTTCTNPDTGKEETCKGVLPHPFLFSNGNLVDINQLIPQNSGWELRFAFDINNSGRIVGEGVHNGNNRAFVLIPIKATQK